MVPIQPTQWVPPETRTCNLLCVPSLGCKEGSSIPAKPKHGKGRDPKTSGPVQDQKTHPHALATKAIPGQSVFSFSPKAPVTDAKGPLGSLSSSQGIQCSHLGCYWAHQVLDFSTMTQHQTQALQPCWLLSWWAQGEQTPCGPLQSSAGL